MDSERTRKPSGSGDPLIGHLLDRRYEIHQVIARGGMATVYLATDTRLQRKVAVKVMHPAMAQDAEFVARFDREARSAAAIDHPNVVSVTDQGHDGDIVFLVMEFVAGRTLRQVLNERSRFTPAEALRVMEPLLDGLGSAHEAGFVHRDIKPENVLLSDDGRVKITDFGLARAVESTPITTDANMLLGTVAYLAPEQVSRGIADSRSDVYACGVLLFELITGSAPHTANTPIAVAYKHVNDDIPAPSSIVPGIPDALDEIVIEATSRDPQERPENGHELLGLLRRAKPEILAASASMTQAMTTQLNRDDTTLLDRGAAPTTVSRRDRYEPADNDTDSHYIPEAGFFSHLWWRYRQHLIGWTALLLALLLVAGAGWWLGSGRFKSAPNLVGLSVAAAQQQAQQKGLKIIQAGEKTYSEDVAAGLVAAQKPGKGKNIKRNGTITLTISLGPLRYSVPQLQGKTLEDGRNAIVAGHMKVGSQSEAYDDTVVSGRIAKTNPPAGTKVKDGTVVAIVVSKGPPPVDAPDQARKKLDDATKTLTGLGFKVTVKRVFNDDVDKDRVISQDKTGQTPKGSTIELTVSDGPEIVTVPDLDGMSREEALAALNAKGLKADFVNIDGSDNVVVSQSPRPNRKVRAGSTVTVYVR